MENRTAPAHPRAANSKAAVALYQSGHAPLPRAMQAGVAPTAAPASRCWACRGRATLLLMHHALGKARLTCSQPAAQRCSTVHDQRQGTTQPQPKQAGVEHWRAARQVPAARACANGWAPASPVRGVEKSAARWPLHAGRPFKRCRLHSTQAAPCSAGMPRDRDSSPCKACLVKRRKWTGAGAQAAGVCSSSPKMPGLVSATPLHPIQGTVAVTAVNPISTTRASRAMQVGTLMGASRQWASGSILLLPQLLQALSRPHEQLQQSKCSRAPGLCRWAVG